MKRDLFSLDLHRRKIKIHASSSSSSSSSSSGGSSSSSSHGSSVGHHHKFMNSSSLSSALKVLLQEINFMLDLKSLVVEVAVAVVAVVAAFN